jgi:aspartyl-tRNA(Asn)/glutamyl-tRNA(Gln) amidotransferase subunit C
VKLTREIVEHVARLAMVDLSEDEKEMLTKQMGEVLLYMERLNEVDTEGVEPTSHVVDLKNVTRCDLPEPPLSRPDVLKNAPDSRDGMFMVPRVIEGEG